MAKRLKDTLVINTKSRTYQIKLYKRVPKSKGDKLYWKTNYTNLRILQESLYEKEC